jgi:hypothetical protein
MFACLTFWWLNCVISLCLTFVFSQSDHFVVISCFSLLPRRSKVQVFTLPGNTIQRQSDHFFVFSWFWFRLAPCGAKAQKIWNNNKVVTLSYFRLAPRQWNQRQMSLVVLCVFLWRLAERIFGMSQISHHNIWNAIAASCCYISFYFSLCASYYV